MQYVMWSVLFIDLCIVIMVLVNWHQLGNVGKRLMLLFAIVIFPAFGAAFINYQAVSSMAQVTFCIRCHTMKEHGKSLEVDDDELLSAVHYQNNYVPKKTACSACHTDYVMLGGLKAKISGLRHIFHYYFSTPPEPKDLKTYKPYNVHNCLYCHAESRRFVEKKDHSRNPELLKSILSGEKGCLVSGCHDVAHDVGDLEDDEDEDEDKGSEKSKSATDTNTDSKED